MALGLQERQFSKEEWRLFSEPSGGPHHCGSPQPGGFRGVEEKGAYSFVWLCFATLIDVSYCFPFCFVQLGNTEGSLHLVDLAGDTTVAEAGECVEESEVRSPAEGFRDRVCNPPSAVYEC